MPIARRNLAGRLGSELKPRIGTFPTLREPHDPTAIEEPWAVYQVRHLMETEGLSFYEAYQRVARQLGGAA
jgi:hypothetical protein